MSVRVTVRGRSLRLRGLRKPPTGVLAILLVFGPGLIAATAGDDAGGIATYSQVGAKYGYDLLWVLAVITVSLALVQETCARLGAATGRGLLDLVRERFGIGWALFAVGVVLLANGGVVVTEFVGIAAAAELFGITRYLAVPVTALLIWYLVIQGSYASVERVFLAMALVFFAYPAAAILGHPDWGAVARGAFIPTVQTDPDYLLLLVGLIGTTITPYMQLFQQSAIVEKGVPRRQYGPERADAYLGSVFGNIIAAFIVIATGATLHAAGITDIQTASDAAQALQPLVGDAAQALFAVGLLGASLLAAGVLPLATAYSVAEAFGFRKGVDLDFRRAPVFVGIFSALIALGAAVALIPNLPLIPLLVGIQVLNGMLLPVILIFLLLLINDRRLVGSLKNGLLYNVLSWGTVVLVTIAVVCLLGSQFLSALGVLGGG
ncbi:MAG TPA: Nramp family divalent metal transporter [Chloroflexota bacterium]|nr:Nramp family divalent metal transporter [Chloroflexota bacterium]